MSVQSSDNNWKLILEWWLELQERNIERRALLTTEGLTTEGLTTGGLALGTGSGIQGEREDVRDVSVHKFIYIYL
jgi:hypothetical protein